MPDNPLAKKLLIKPGNRLLVLNSPGGYLALLGDLPEGAVLDTNPQGAYDVVQAFAHSKADADRLVPIALEALKPGGVLWFCYPKGTSKVKTDVTRDKGCGAMWGRGLGCHRPGFDRWSWSAGRFRPSSDVNSGRRQGASTP